MKKIINIDETYQFQLLNFNSKHLQFQADAGEPSQQGTIEVKFSEEVYLQISKTKKKKKNRNRVQLKKKKAN